MYNAGWFCTFIVFDFEQVSEEVERALAKLGPAMLTGRYEIYSSAYNNVLSEPNSVSIYPWTFLSPLGNHGAFS